METLGPCTNWFDDWKVGLRNNWKKKKKLWSIPCQQWHDTQFLHLYENTHMKSRVLTSTKENFLTLPKNKFTSLCSECPTKIDGQTVITTKPTGKCMLSWELPHWLGVGSFKKFEMKFQRKVNKYLPSLIKSLDSSIMEKCNKNLGKVISSIFGVFLRSENTGRSHLLLTLFMYRMCSITWE